MWKMYEKNGLPLYDLGRYGEMWGIEEVLLLNPICINDRVTA